MVAIRPSSSSVAAHVVWLLGVKILSDFYHACDAHGLLALSIGNRETRTERPRQQGTAFQRDLYLQKVVEVRSIWTVQECTANETQISRIWQSRCVASTIPTDVEPATGYKLLIAKRFPLELQFAAVRVIQKAGIQPAEIDRTYICKMTVCILNQLQCLEMTAHAQNQ
jgi:hypothetical protein